MELSRADKTVMYNCYAEQTNLNMFHDSGNLVVSVLSTQQDTCKIPHGILLSLQIDSLGIYEPQIYQVDYDYFNTNQFNLLCDNPICSNLNKAKAAQLIIETKTHITYVKIRSIRLTNGLATNCFNDNESKIELLNGAIIADLYPTYSCLNSIVTKQLGKLLLKTPDNARVFIIYSDNSISVHDPVYVEVLNAEFVPTHTVNSNSKTIRVKLSKTGISNHFIQSLDNGVITKAVKKIMVHLQFTTDLILIKTTQTIVNNFKFTGIQDAYSDVSIQLIYGGFVIRKFSTSKTSYYNDLLTSQGVTSCASEYVFTLKDVSKTDKFWFRIIETGLPSYLLNGLPLHNTCSERFPNQQCDQLAEQLQQYKLAELSVRENIYYYNESVQINNFTVTIVNMTDSCFQYGYIYTFRKEKQPYILMKINIVNIVNWMITTRFKQ
ncbi:Conserved_hypothetical protein [Hexamita inflata]|uniref:Uncharacterized protein n=1 Tax=Hexamita inflata TaxID=28002 RepID=A0AA86QHQ0_9EUKA|nr:Conserved hypothetical protein [Hexamita inflata]